MKWGMDGALGPEAPEGVFFKTELFDVEAGEDEETNPGMYGRQLASWLRERLDDLGYQVQEVIPEDWGWCVLCQREPYRMWVGCSCLSDPEDEGGGLPVSGQITWHCFGAVDKGIFAGASQRGDRDAALSKLRGALSEILEAERAIQIVENP